MSESQRVWPRAWLMTDERLGNRLWEAIERVPAGHGGVVFRHYSLGSAERAELAERVASACRARGLTLAVAADLTLALRLGAALVHNPRRYSPDLPFSRAVHSLADAEAARAQGAALAFVSPLYPTRSHPDVAPLDTGLAGAIAAACGCPAIALGGMDERNFENIARDGFYGWAGIDAWIRT